MYIFIISSLVILGVLLSFLLLSRQKDEPDEYEIEQCPNPNCVRCRRYSQVNASAQRQLASKDHKYELQRLVKAVQTGPKHTERRTSGVSPTSGQHPTVLLVRGLSTRPLVTDLHQLVCQTLYKESTSHLLKEYIDAQQDNEAEWLQNDVRGRKWEVLHLINQGEWNPMNMKACPRTTALLKALPNVMEGCLFGNAFVSVLETGTTIEPHCGPTNVRHRLHYGLDIPATTTNLPILTVLKEQQTWETGQCFVFDDSLMHSVDYPATDKEETAPRVVLIVDLWHPELSQLERDAITQLYPTNAATG
jgi:hypothetical protein